MSTLRMLPSGKWNAQVRVAGRRPRSRSFETNEQAKSWADQLEIKLRGIVTREKPIDPTWEEMALQYCDTMLMGKSSQKQAIYKSGVIGRDALFRKPFAKMTPADINAYKTKRLQKVGPTTVHNEMVFIKRIFRWADREAQAAGKSSITNPCDFVPLPRPRKPRDKVIERHELDKLIAALPSMVGTIVELGYETAMRRSEIVKLQVKHLHLDQRLLSVINGKEGDRSVPLTRRAVVILQDVAASCHGPESVLFDITPHAVSTAVRRARRTAGLSEDIRFHQLRHTRCTIVARKGFNQAQMMVVTGHRDIRSVQRYTHLNAADVVKLLD
ncbi:MAG: site-specific integrase [Rhizobiaceae bacterium]